MAETQRPWHGSAFDLPDEPTDEDLRRALRILQTGGAVTGPALWLIACTRRLKRLGPDTSSPEAEAAYKRVAAIVAALQPPPTGVLNKAGRGLVKPRVKPHGRVGDVVPVDATDDDIRRLYGEKDAAAIIEFRRMLEQLEGTDG